MAIAPIGPFVRFVIFGASAVYANWDTIASQFDRFDEAPSVVNYGYYSQHVFEMKDGAGAFTPRERGMYGVHWVNTTGGSLDTTWTVADFTAVETKMEGVWTNLLSFISTDFRLVEHRWYGYGPGVHPPNPPARIRTIPSPIQGTSTNASAHQMASTVTLRTPLRRHWGRIYLPISSNKLGVGGQFSSGDANTIAAAAKDGLIGSATSNGIVPVVYDRNRKSVLGVTAYEVDSVPDVIRRRRPRTATSRAIISS